MIVRIGEAIIDCFEAHSPGEQATGLSETDSLPDGMGMLFSYADEQEHSFWMPESMKFPLDIIFVGADGLIGKVDSLPLGAPSIKGSGKWVIEVPASFCAKAHIKEGDKVSFEEEHADEVEASTSSDLLRTLSTARQARRTAFKKGADQKWDFTRSFVTLPQEFSDCVALKGECFVEELFMMVGFASTLMLDDVFDTEQACGLANELCLLARKYEELAGKKGYSDQFTQRLNERLGQSTETAPYQRPPSVAPGSPSQERFKDHNMVDMKDLDGGVRVTEGPIHDESWNSPTRARLK